VQVNDAPALKQSNIGVAMGITGTDVAKSAADMVLTDDNFASIVEAIEEGRTIYANITKFVFFLLSTNVGEVFVILIAVLIGLQSPLLPIQILWLNLATDGAPAIALALEAPEPGIMEEGPRKLSEPIVDKLMMAGVVVHSTILTVLCLACYVVGLSWHTGVWDGQPSKPDYYAALPDSSQANYTDARNTADRLSAEFNDNVDYGVRQARTMTIILIVFAELLRAYSSRSLRRSLWVVGTFKNKWMQYAVFVAIALTIFFATCPGFRDVIFSEELLDVRSWVLVLSFSGIPVVCDELLKVVYRRTRFGERRKHMTRSMMVLEQEEKEELRLKKSGKKRLKKWQQKRMEKGEEKMLTDEERKQMETEMDMELSDDGDSDDTARSGDEEEKKAEKMEIRVEMQTLRKSSQKAGDYAPLNEE
jgi:Ca2+-transporting ATPase